MDESEEQRSFAKRHGKWSQVGVPHRGWTCVDVGDLGSPDAECEMCETTSIRYVHYMEHPNYPDRLGVGCICAGNMEGSLRASRARESAMKSRASKRERWLTRTWKTSTKGNLTIVSDGYRVTVYRRGAGWGCTVAARDDSEVQHSKRNYETQAEAQLAGFDQISRDLAKESR
jgi:hypothetical protein